MNKIIPSLALLSFVVSSPIDAKIIHHKTQGLTTANPSRHAHETTLAFRMISELMTINKQNVVSVKLVAADEHYSRIEIKLTPEAARNLAYQGKNYHGQKMVMTIGDQIISSLVLQQDNPEGHLLVSISTSTSIAQQIIKALS